MQPCGLTLLDVPLLERALQSGISSTRKMILREHARYNTAAIVFRMQAAWFQPSKTWYPSSPIYPCLALSNLSPLLSLVLTSLDKTARINNPDLSAAQQGNALRFLIHFIGDIHQPLHTEAELRGGNGIPVLFGKKHTTLHTIWDNDIPERIRGGNLSDEYSQASAWADDLFANGIEGSCTDISTPEACALVWAGEANKEVCRYVLKDDLEGVENRDLSGDYYEGAVPIVEELIAKAGYRLGAWLNALAEVSQAAQGNLKHEEQEL